MPAAVGLKIAVHEAQHLIPGAQPGAIGQCEHGDRVGPHKIGVDTIKAHLNHPAQCGREGRGLPLSRREGGIRPQERGRQMSAARLCNDGTLKGGAGFKLRIKAGVRAFRLIEKLRVDQQPRLGPDGLQKQRLPPAGVAKDHIGHKPMPVAQRPGCPRHRKATIGGFRISAAKPAGRRLRRLRRGTIAQHPHRGGTGIGGIRQRQNLMATAL